MADISKEQAVQLALSAGFMKFLKPESRPEMICGPDEILRLVKLGRNAGLDAALQELKRTKTEVAGSLGVQWTVPVHGTQERCVRAIESLKDNTP